jgi:hypothetical protein
LSDLIAEAAENESGRRLQASFQQQRMGISEHPNCTVMALVSPANRFTSGSIVAVDDGISITSGGSRR